MDQISKGYVNLKLACNSKISRSGRTFCSSMGPAAGLQGAGFASLGARIPCSCAVTGLWGWLLVAGFREAGICHHLNPNRSASESESLVVRRTSMSYFVPPCNYEMVEYDLSRSGQCHQLNFPFLERLNLKTVIYLSYDEPSQPLLSFLEDQGFDLIRPSPEIAELHSQASSMSEAEVILSSQYYPLHVMCKFGHHSTGTVIGCLRKLQGWNLTAIFEEYRRYAGSKVRFLNEQFIELFDTDLVRIPVDHPNWL